MNSLPNELLFKICEHLSFKDLLRCRLVCKRLKSVCNQVKIKELAIGKSDFWAISRPVADGNRIEKGLVLNLSLFNFKYLKHLEINKFINVKLEMNDLNKFTYLECLKIEYFKNSKESKLSLPNLKRLVLFHVDHFDSNLTLETPKLEDFMCSKVEKLKFVYPESLKILELEWFLKNLEEFKNVEIFTCPDVPANILEQMPKLKELHFSAGDLYRQSGFFEDPKEAIRQIIGSKVALGRDDLKIYYKDMHLENGEADLSDDEDDVILNYIRNH